MVAGADGFGEAGGAFGLQAGEEDCGLDLGAGDGGVEVDGVERAAVDGDGGVAVAESRCFAPICVERFADALHGAAGEGVVADEGEGVGVRRDEAGEHAHGGAGVAAVERSGGLLECAGDAGDRDGLVRIVDDRGAEGLHAGEGGVRVGAGGEVGEARGAFGDAGEHGVAVGDGLVAGEGEGALQGAGGADELNGRCGRHCSLA